MLARLSFILALATATAGQTQTTLRPEDAARLDGFTTAAGNALMQALSAGAPNDVAALTNALAGKPQIAFDETLAGDWNCRTIKLGGLSPLLVYSPFRCRITAGSEGFDFEKLTGSQRTKGTILLRNGRAIYVGVGVAGNTSAPEYADLPPDFVSNGSIQTDVAIFERISPTRGRLMFPSPALESDFDILELTR